MGIEWPYNFLALRFLHSLDLLVSFERHPHQYQPAINSICLSFESTSSNKSSSVNGLKLKAWAKEQTQKNAPYN